MPNPLQHLGSNSVATVKEMSGGGGGGRRDFFQWARKKSENSVSSQRNTKSYLKVSEKSGNYCHYDFVFGYSHAKVWERVSLLAKVMLSQKTFIKELISVASSLALLAKDLSIWP